MAERRRGKRASRRSPRKRRERVFWTDDQGVRTDREPIGECEWCDRHAYRRVWIHDVEFVACYKHWGRWVRRINAEVHVSEDLENLRRALTDADVAFGLRIWKGSRGAITVSELARIVNAYRATKGLRPVHRNTIDRRIVMDEGYQESEG